jgi:hypothetical protein
MHERAKAAMVARFWLVLRVILRGIICFGSTAEWTVGYVYENAEDGEDLM